MATNCLDKIPIYLKEPLLLDNGTTTGIIYVMCGKCARCLQRRKMEWSFRMNEERKISKTAYFVTLTYNTENVPYATTYYNKKTKKTDILKQYRYKTLNKHDLEKFFKKLRKNQKNSETTLEHLRNNLKNEDKIKYYACGEYGSQRNRPHFHAILYNTSRAVIEKSWSMGDVQVLPANNASVSYVMKYLDKRLDKTKDKTKEPEFNTMSEGIGLEYVRKNGSWHKANIDILYVSNETGIKVPMPKYYREKIFSESERKAQAILVTNIMEELDKENIQHYGYKRFITKQDGERKFSKEIFKKACKSRIID